MPYTFYKGALLTNEEYGKVKDELDKKEQEYLRLLLGEEFESEKGLEEDPPAEAAGASEEPVEPVETAGPVEPVEPVEPVDNQEVHPKAESRETPDSEEPEVKRTRRKRQS